MRKIVIILLYLFIVKTSGNARCHKCERNSDNTRITCPDSIERIFEIDYTLNNFKITCTYGSNIHLDLTALENCTFPDVFVLKIESCALPDLSLVEILRPLNISNLQKLTLELNQFDNYEMSANLFNGLSEVSYNLISHNILDSIHPEAFRPLANLRTMYINHNNIKVLSKKLFFENQNLELLDLGHNKIRQLEDGVFSNLPNLVTLALYNNEISSIDGTMLNNSAKLTLLSVSSNKLTNLSEDSFANLTSLKKLYIRNNKLKNLPENIFSDCVNLLELDIHDNNIEEIPKTIFQNNNKLQILGLHSNLISELDETTFSNLTQLTNLTLRRNLFKTFPVDIFKYQNMLLQLDLQSNIIESLPGGIFDNLSNVYKLVLANNSLSELPNFLFSKCVSLKVLFLNINQLTTIQRGLFFRDRLHMERLNLSYNNLTDVGLQALNGLLDVEQLDVSYNKLTHIPYPATSLYINIRKLNLEGNQIEKIPTYDLLTLSNDMEINLSKNQIKTVEKFGFENIEENSKRFYKFDFSENPFECDCNLSYFIRFIKNHTQHSYSFTLEKLSNWKCNEPFEFTNRPLVSVDIESLKCFSDVCPNKCSCWKNVYGFTYDCRNINLTEIPTILNKTNDVNNKKNLSLILDNNNIMNFEKLKDPIYKNLHHLSLVNNNLSAITSSFPEGLKTIDLRYNRFHHFNEESLRFLNETNSSLRLSYNPWKCDCNLKETKQFMSNRKSQIRDIDDVKCSNLEGKIIHELSMSEMCIPFFMKASFIYPMIGVLLVIFISFILVTYKVTMNRHNIKVWLYNRRICLWAITEQDRDSDKKYDAFISYASEDESFINDNLLKMLEHGDPQYKICIHYRDWIVGENIATQIINSVYSSRRTIVVLSNHFLNSIWGRLEFQAAFKQALNDKTNRIILIVLGELPDASELDELLRFYISNNTYLEWGDPKFRERLLYAMPHYKLMDQQKKSSRKKKKLDTIKLTEGQSQISVMA